MNAPEPTPVVVVGLGPVGATLALLLARQGVRVLAVERDLEVFPHPRAVALDDGALRVLQAAGALEPPGFPLRPGGVVRLTDGSGRTLVELPPPPADGGHPALSFFRQPELEARLRGRLDAEPLIEVLLGHEVVGVRDEAGHALVTVRSTSGSGDPGTAAGTGRDGGPDPTAGDGPTLPWTVRARWVLACDGGRSGLRRDRGLRLLGRTSGHRWLVVDGTSPPGADPSFTFACDPRRPWVHGPLPDGGHRWEFLLTADEGRGASGDGTTGSGRDGTTGEGRDETPESLATRLLHERLAGTRPAVSRASVYVFHARIAPRLRAGRVLLVGDAAHLAPPFAGQGLGAGLRDAHNLAWKIAAIHRDGRPERLLRSYARERLPHVLTTTALAVGLGALVQVRRGRTARVRDAALTRLVASRRVRAWIHAGGWRPPTRIGGPLVEGRGDRRAGFPLPQPDVTTADGASVPLDALLGRGWAVVTVDEDGPEAGSAGSAPLSGSTDAPAAAAVVRVGPGTATVVRVVPDASARGTFASTCDENVCPGPTGTVDDCGVLRDWLAPATVALVRPDRVVFGTTDHVGLAALVERAERALGTVRRPD